MQGIWVEHQRVHRLIPFAMVFSLVSAELQGGSNTLGVGYGTWVSGRVEPWTPAAM
jgi:hypothetical protein